MIPDGFQYFLDDFWNFENFTKSRPSDPVLLMDDLAYLWLIYGFNIVEVLNGILINIIFG